MMLLNMRRISIIVGVVISSVAATTTTTTTTTGNAASTSFHNLRGWHQVKDDEGNLHYSAPRQHHHQVWDDMNHSDIKLIVEEGRNGDSKNTAEGDDEEDYVSTMKRLENEIEELFERYDENEDGWFTFEDYSKQLRENKQFLLRYNPTPEERNSNRLGLTSFDAMDTDGDGIVHFAEFFTFIVANLPDLTTINELRQHSTEVIDWLVLVVVAEYLGK